MAAKPVAKAADKAATKAEARHTPPNFAARLIAWHKRHGRHDLPWQCRDPYAVWLSEIMLQQTQVGTVIPYYRRFLERFPTVQKLAAAPLDDVLTLWSGLGYYSRARNLHKAAQQLVANHGGVMPADPDVVQTLPGIGRSTAAAICVFAHGGRHAILDGNVKRVLARYCGVHGYPGETRVHERLWMLAEALLPPSDKNVRKTTAAATMIAYTQGLMDLGASLCSRSKPQCERCPLNTDCVAHQRGLTHLLPGKKPRAALPQRETVMLVMRNAGEILLERRPASGIWGGLWSLPEVAHERDAASTAKRHGVSVVVSKALPLIAHGFTHYKLNITPLLLEVKKSRSHAPGVPGTVWLSAEDAARAAIPTPVRIIIVSI